MWSTKMYRLILPIAMVLAAAIVGCAPGGNLCIGGYTTEPPFDPNIRSVYIPVFKRNTFLTNPYRTLDVDITESVVRELTARKCPIRIVSDPSKADTELIGTIVDVTKLNYIYNIQALPRDVEIAIRVEVIWRDLRSGEVLTNPAWATPPVKPSPQEFDPSVAPSTPRAPAGVVKPLSVTGRGRLLPELGESNTSASNMASANIARQIVNLMEKAW